MTLGPGCLGLSLPEVPVEVYPGAELSFQHKGSSPRGPAPLRPHREFSVGLGGGELGR